MSFNIRYFNLIDGLQSWENRKSSVFQILEKYKPDLIGFQEVLPNQMEDLKNLLCNSLDYKFQSHDRSDGNLKSEECPIFYRKLKANDQGIFWLSKTPEIPSKHWGVHFRHCNWVSFGGDLPFVYYNTHLDHLYTGARIKGMEVLYKKIPEISNDKPSIVSGDFNFGPKSKEYKLFSKFMADSYILDKDNSGKKDITFHNFTGQTTFIPRRFHRKVINDRIDFIWVSKNIEVISSNVLFDIPSKDLPIIYPSDHWPVLATLSII
jgi:endonuclease/exonuclease/phosphatase family metal-dependent hydrolase